MFGDRLPADLAAGGGKLLDGLPERRGLGADGAVLHVDDHQRRPLAEPGLPAEACRPIGLLLVVADDAGPGLSLSIAHRVNSLPWRECAGLIALLEGVELLLGDGALALVEAGEPVADILQRAVLLERGEHIMRRAQRGLQRGIGVEHAGKSHLGEPGAAEVRRLAAVHDVGDLRDRKLLGDACHLGLVDRRLDERHVGTRLDHRMRAIDRGVEAEHRARIGARDDLEILVPPRIDRGLHLAQHLVERNDVFARRSGRTSSETPDPRSGSRRRLRARAPSRCGSC